MGQQQLLIIVMGIVITMLTIAIGMQAFSEGQRKANADAMVDDAISIASDVQAWRLHPAAMGGGSGVSTDGFTLATIGYEVSEGNEFSTGNGTFTAYAQGNAVVVQGDNAELDNRILVAINGRGSVCTQTRLTQGSDDSEAPVSSHETCKGF